MNKTELIDAIATKSECTKAAAGKMLDAFIDTVSQQMADGDKVVLVGFGTFQTGTRAAREGRNPRTGETIKIAAAVVPKFTPGQSLKTKVNTKPAKKKK
ncbi:MAG: HU family DNA-binding protein [Gammaproteobacteria bacterium]|nr:HU family DNA-binding protein [Gammaproteobacteria bacterium]MBU0849357.1 HU family DNA-binding protein [Gammaproteobacteria bacterium]MBU1266508.1 HU family DNA-binding protein [Gammaproteobacteria bacterium]MBU1779622.1 HU family DNA-binding protein [Gammaproteobacteria bacterium]MBU2088522.1 HU family DNA-binding protein [Gammaproteobacteria bacterium]